MPPPSWMGGCYRRRIGVFEAGASSDRRRFGVRSLCLYIGCGCRGGRCNRTLRVPRARVAGAELWRTCGAVEAAYGMLTGVHAGQRNSPCGADAHAGLAQGVSSGSVGLWPCARRCAGGCAEPLCVRVSLGDACGHACHLAHELCIGISGTQLRRPFWYTSRPHCGTHTVYTGCE